MAAVTFDTLKVARRLTQAGLDARTAEGVSETLAEVMTDREDALATKADIALLGSGLDGLRGELHHESEMLRVEMAAQGDKLRGEMRALHSDTLRWVIGSIFAAMAVLFAGIKLV